MRVPVKQNTKNSEEDTSGERCHPLCDPELTYESIIILIFVLHGTIAAKINFLQQHHHEYADPHTSLVAH